MTGPLFWAIRSLGAHSEGQREIPAAVQPLLLDLLLARQPQPHCPSIRTNSHPFAPNRAPTAVVYAVVPWTQKKRLFQSRLERTESE